MRVDASMGNGQPQMRDAGFEVVLETGNGTRQSVGMVSAEAGGEIAGDRPRGRAW